METELEKILALDEFEMNIGRIKQTGKSKMANIAMLMKTKTSSEKLDINGLAVSIEDLSKDVQAVKKIPGNRDKPFFMAATVESLIERIQFLEKVLAHFDNYAQTLNVQVNELKAKPAGIMITEKEAEVPTSDYGFHIPDHQHTRAEQVANIEMLMHFIDALSGMVNGDSINDRIAKAKKLEFYIKEMAKYFALDTNVDSDDAIVASFLEALIIAKKIKPALETLAL